MYADVGGQSTLKMFEKVPSERDTYRFFVIPRIRGSSHLPTTQVDIIPPRSALDFTVGIIYRCSTCVVIKGGSSGTVHMRK
jgi:hypothetical protein